MPTNKDLAWEALDKYYHLLSTAEAEGFAELTADQISNMRTICPEIKFEPRLLTHFDNHQQQPKIFKDNHLSLLPRERGSYVIGYFDPFRRIIGPKGQADFESYGDFPIERISSPKHLQSATTENRFNETMGMNWLANTGTLAKFVGEEDLMPTVAGRYAGGEWDYWVRSRGNLVRLSAENPQIEVDAGYESDSYLVLTEAKNSAVWEFCMRQLYFPFRAWKRRVSKPIRTIFVAIDGDDFYLVEYRFPEPEVFEAQLVGAKHYIIGGAGFTKRGLQRLHDDTSAEPEPNNVPFPQANSVPTVMDVIQFMAENPHANKNDIAEFVGFTDRQSDYYCHAAEYLGFLRKPGAGKPYELTKKGWDFCDATTKDSKRWMFAEAMMRRAVFREMFEKMAEDSDASTDRDLAIRIMKKHINFNTDGMYIRRAGTVTSWMKWMQALIQK